MLGGVVVGSVVTVTYSVVRALESEVYVLMSRCVGYMAVMEGSPAEECVRMLL